MFKIRLVTAGIVFVLLRPKSAIYRSNDTIQHISIVAERRQLYTQLNTDTTTMTKSLF
ncbi:hypothetical protein [Alkalihalobacillus sp. TS-13]|uniref:hypothetical protein n=1 Tax=Alkalihalobacillus sp. TS-13 TaxID=2842455 RepID=UPI001C8839E6|nr:hypothetical protein [Alkalihalobacillus sp. TS-13]